MTAPAGRSRVRFLVAGVQKGGTSALFEYLREVPSLQLPAVKEAHHFDDEAIDWSSPDHAAYHALFEEDGRMWGEATPIYTYWPESPARIRAYHPAMRLILLFRDPIARAWSHWQMEYARGKESEPFAWCIRDGRARVAATGRHRVYSYVERGFYGAQVARWLRCFPREQMLFLRSNDLRRDPDGSVAAICDFLGVARPSVPLRPRSVRAAPDRPYPSRLTPSDIAHLGAIYADDMRDFAAATDLILSNPATGTVWFP